MTTNADLWPYLAAEELYEIFATQYEPVYERGEDREMFWRDVLAGAHGRYFPPLTPEVRI